MKNEMILNLIDAKIAEYMSNKKWAATEAMQDLTADLIALMRSENSDAEERAEFEAHLGRY
mgnify:CR=1 FL=1